MGCRARGGPGTGGNGGGADVVGVGGDQQQAVLLLRGGGNARGAGAGRGRREGGSCWRGSVAAPPPVPRRQPPWHTPAHRPRSLPLVVPALPLPCRPAPPQANPPPPPARLPRSTSSSTPWWCQPGASAPVLRDTRGSEGLPPSETSPCLSLRALPARPGPRRGSARFFSTQECPSPIRKNGCLRGGESSSAQLRSLGIEGNKPGAQKITHAKRKSTASEWILKPLS